MFFTGISGQTYLIVFKHSAYQHFSSTMRKENKEISDYASETIKNIMDAFIGKKLNLSEYRDWDQPVSENSVWHVSNFQTMTVHRILIRDGLNGNCEYRPVLILVDAVIYIPETNEIKVEVNQFPDTETNEIKNEVFSLSRTEVFPITSDTSPLSGDFETEDLENFRDLCVPIDNLIKAGLKTKSWIIPVKTKISTGLLKCQIGEVSDSLVNKARESAMEFEPVEPQL